LSSLEARARELWGDGANPPELAREGMQLSLAPRLEPWHLPV